MKRKELDYKKLIDSDDLDNTMDHVRGIGAILNAMQLSIASGGTITDSMAFFVLQNSCNMALKELEEMKPQVDFMLEEIQNTTVGE